MSSAFKSWKAHQPQGITELAAKVMANEYERDRNRGKPPHQIKRRDTPEIRAMLASGEGYKIVAAKFDLCLTSIWRTANEMGLRRHRRPGGK